MAVDVGESGYVGAMGCGAVKSVIHEATWRGCAGTMTRAAKLRESLRGFSSLAAQE